MSTWHRWKEMNDICACSASQTFDWDSHWQNIKWNLTIEKFKAAVPRILGEGRQERWDFWDWVGVVIEKGGRNWNKFKQDRGLAPMMTICTELRDINKSVLGAGGNQPSSFTTYLHVLSGEIMCIFISQCIYSCVHFLPYSKEIIQKKKNILSTLKAF